MKKTVTTYYLEMTDISEFSPKQGYNEKLEIKAISKDIFQHWMLFVGVGLPWRWYSRLSWSPDDWDNYLKNTNTQTYLAFSETSMVGYFELTHGDNNTIEIKFLGLFASSIGEGYGSSLLSHAVDLAWKSGPNKVWLHTCTSDHASALSNYLARGFKIINETEEDEILPDKDDYLKLVNDFVSKYIDNHNTFWN